MLCQEVILKTEELAKQFGGLRAVDNVSLEVNEKEILALIGPNGAGKTTLINLITGVLTPDAGRVLFRGKDITRLPTFERARLGIARTFQVLRPFTSLTVRDNIMVALGHHECPSLLAMFKKRTKTFTQKIVDEILAETRLEQWANYIAGTLPVGVLRRVEIARALALNPLLLLLDEPAAGLNDQELQELSVLITSLQNRRNLTILLVEHRMRFVMRTCQRIIVMHRGRVIAEGTPEKIANDPMVIEVYLGKLQEPYVADTKS